MHRYKQIFDKIKYHNNVESIDINTLLKYFQESMLDTAAFRNYKKKGLTSFMFFFFCTFFLCWMSPRAKKKKLNKEQRNTKLDVLTFCICAHFLYVWLKEDEFDSDIMRCLQSTDLQKIMNKYKKCENKLIAACANNDINKVKKLLNDNSNNSMYKKEINLKCLGLTALHIACIENDDTDIADILIQNGANINATTDNGRTPLSYAVEYQKIDFIDFLLNNKANPNLKS